jgi:hypothetical protein
VKLEEARTADGRVTALVFSVGKDPLRLVKGARLWLKPEGGEERTSQPDFKEGRLEVPVEAPGVEYRFELVGAKNAVLLSQRGAAKAELPRPAVVAGDPPPTPPPAVVVAESPPPAPSRWRLPTGIVLAVAGAGALGTGGYFGYQAADARRRLTNAMRDSMNVVTEFTQVEAKQLDDRATTGAVIADALLIGGGVLAATGVALIIFELASGGDAQVSLAPAPNGAALVGTF